MKRRTFLTTSSTVGVASAVPGGFVASSIFSSINTSMLLKEFNSSTKSVLDKLMTDVKLNLKSMDLDEDLAKKIVMPVKIIKKKSSSGNHSILYKNKAGEFVSLSVSKGVQRIKISKSI